MTSGRRAQIVAAALDLIETGGPEALTMRALAERVGIRAASLYRHFADKEAVEVAMIAAAFANQAVAGEAAIMGTDRPLAAIGRVYRRWALDHPHLYRLMTDRPLPRADLPDGLEARAAAPLIDIFGGDVDRARAAWAFAHGMTLLELAGRFPPGADLDAAWVAGSAALEPNQPADKSNGGLPGDSSRHSAENRE
jgi:AcrR family transcriptional regulator